MSARKPTALLLSWVVPATSLWAAAPPPVPSTRSAPHAVAVSVPAPAPARRSPAPSPLRTSVAGPRYHPSPAVEAQPPAPSTPSGSVIVGKALSDATGLPVADAEVRIAGSDETLRLTDGEGRYAIPATAGEHWILVEKAGFVPVERRVVAAAGLGAPVLDARPTPLAASTTVGPSGGPATTGNVRVTIPAGAVTEDTGFIVTPLTGQGLPGYLPVGYAPVAAFALQAGRVVSGPFAARFSGLPSGVSLHLVEYRRTEHAWHLLEASVGVDEGVATTSIPGVGAFALVAVDQGGPSLPGPGGALTGSAAAAWPVGATGSALAAPIRIPATGATGLAHTTLNSPSALPSGMTLQAQLTERFTVGGGVPFEDEPRLQDVVAYRSQPVTAQTLKATIPLTPVRTFGRTVPVSGNLHCEFWTSRAPQGGSVGGGSESVTVESGPARLTVAAGSLPTDTAVSIQSVPLSAFLPAVSGVTALGEVVVDLSGAVLGQSAELSLAASGEGTLVIAKVERLSGVPYLVVVSLAQVQGDRIVSTPYPGLAGIVHGGRHVFYRLDSPIGFVAGTTSSPAGPIQAVVGTAGLPFVGVSSAAGGGYITASKPGTAIEVTARVPTTPHEAAGTVAVTAGQTTSLDLSLTAGVTTVEVVPADGSTGVPVSVAILLTANQPLDEATVTAATVKLIKGNPSTGPVVSTRFVLSADRKVLSVIPESSLEPATVYALRVLGVRDAYRGNVNVNDVHFTTKADVAPEYDLGKLKFSFPDESGMVTVSAAAGSFPPASTILIVNEQNGVVLTVSVGNEGEVSSTLPATLDDVMTVTLEDPLGNVVTARQSKYVDVATGRMAIGTTGGVVEGTGGVELRLPPGAVSRGVVFKADLVNPSDIPAEQRPQLGEAHLSSAIRIQAPSKPTFAREADLVFPKPADAPAGAFYYVVRKVTGPEGRVFFQTLDTAAVEGDKVVTSSYPFPGYMDSIGVFGYLGGRLALNPVGTSMAFLTWGFDAALPGRSPMGIVSGRVTRSQWDPVTRRWEYAPVPGVIVRRLVNGEDPFQAGAPGTTFATTIDDGTYVLFDGLYTGGLVTVRATDPATGQEAEAIAYGVDPQERPVWAQPYRAMATANLAFTASAGPRPEATLRVLERSGEAWQFSDGLVVTGEPIVIGVSVANATLENATFDGSPLSLRDGGPEHQGLQKVADQTIGQTGPHTVSITLRPLVGSLITESASFLVIAEGGDNNQVLPDRAPEVIVPRLQPQPDATAVSPGIFPEVAFTEPVVNVPGNVTLHELAPDGSEGEALSIQLYGTGPQGPVTPVTFTTASQVSALTIRPTGGLKYLTRYRLKLAGTIHDLDSSQPTDPQELAPFSFEFETFRSGTVGGSQERFLSAGIVVMEDRAWLVQNNFINGILRTFDVSDPVEPQEVGTPYGIAGRPVDVAGQAGATAIPEVSRLLVVAQTVTSQSRPSNLHVFDVSTDSPERIAAASVSRNAVDGTLSRVEVKGQHAYTLTWHKGVQVVDLHRAKENFDAELAATGNTVRMDELLARDGAGFGLDAAVQTIRITKPYEGPPDRAPHWLLTDLKVGDYVYGGQAQPLVFVTGELGFALVNPQAGNWTMPATLQVGASRLTFGYALALGHLEGNEIALVAGTGQANHPVTGVSAAGPVLAIVNLSEILSPSDPPEPQVLSVVPLFGGSFELASAPTDVILKDHLAIVASDRNAIVVDLSSLTQPQIVGAIEGIGGRLAAGHGSLIFSSLSSVTGGQSELGGIRSASTGRISIVTGHNPDPIVLSAAEEVFGNVDLAYKVLPPDPEITSGTVQVAVRGGSTVMSLPALLNPAGAGSVTWPQGTIVNPLRTYDARLSVLKDGQALPSAPKRLRFATVPVAITTRDRMLRIQFALPEQGLFTEKHYSVKVYLAPQGQAFPASPSFSVWSQEIEAAYPNIDVWWDDLRAGSARAEASWVTRKLDRMDLPAGTDTSIRRQAFEIGTVLAGYPKVKVVVVSDETGRELRVTEGVVSADGEWSAVLEKINDRVRAAAGDLVPPEPILPAPGFFDPSQIFGRLRGLSYRCALLLDNYNIATQGGFLKGLIDGFWAGVDGDKDTILMLRTAFTQNPVTTARALWDFLQEVKKAFPQMEDMKRLVRQLYENSRYPTLDEAVLWAGDGAYYSGFLMGFVAEQAVVAIALAATTAGIGEVCKLAMNAVRAVGWIGRLVERSAVLIRSVGYMLQAAARASRVPDFAKVCLSFARESEQALVAFFQKYERVDRILEKLTAAVQTSRVAAGRALYWLTIVDRMGDEAAVRFVTFFEKKQAADAWLTRWTGLTNGKRAVREAFEATERAGDMADGAHDALVLAGTLEHPVPTLTYPKAFADRYGDRLESALRRLRDSADDTRFPDGVVGQTVRDLSDPKLPVLSDSAVEGAAKSMLRDCVI